MPKLCYKDRRFSPVSLARIAQANAIIESYQRQGFVLTARQLYYQFVAKDYIPNTQKSYSNLTSLISNARLAGLIDWEAIEDRTRNLERLPHWGSPAGIIHASARSFALDKWANQPTYVEVWVEKEALAGIFEQACDEHDVPWLACRGYVSQSEMWRAAERMKARYESGQDCVILHFGDHDPSGLDMTRDIRDRMYMFNAEVNVRRIALNMDQIEAFNPPPNPAKQTDSRFADYEAQYGDESWELDALEPSVLVELIDTEVLALRDDERWNTDVEAEEEHRQWLSSAASNWDAIVQFMQEEDDG